MNQLHKDLNDMEVGHRMKLDDYNVVIAVPGGWIFTTSVGEAMTSTYVPKPQMPTIASGLGQVRKPYNH